MTWENKSIALHRLYEIYDSYIAETLKPVCGPGCAVCCTRNVILTTLEGRGIMAFLARSKQLELLSKVAGQAHGKRFIPRLTTNALVRLFANSGEAPEEMLDPDWGPCPLLDQGRCRIYPARPFGCRCLLSTVRCAPSGFAEIDEFTITLNQVFLQTIEHLDRDGYTANLTDMLLYLAASENPESLPEQPDQAAQQMTANTAIPLLLVPPEHRLRIQPVLEDINRICVQGHHVWTLR